MVSGVQTEEQYRKGIAVWECGNNARQGEQCGNGGTVRGKESGVGIGECRTHDPVAADRP